MSMRTNSNSKVLILLTIFSFIVSAPMTVFGDDSTVTLSTLETKGYTTYGKALAAQIAAARLASTRRTRSPWSDVTNPAEPR